MSLYARIAAGLVVAAISPIALADTPNLQEPTMTMSTDTKEANRALVRASFERWRDGTGSPFELLADDAPWTIVGRSAAAGTYPNREAFMKDVIAPFNARMRTGLKPRKRWPSSTASSSTSSGEG